MEASPSAKPASADRAPKLLGLQRGVVARGAQEDILGRLAGQKEADSDAVRGQHDPTAAMRWLTSFASSLDARSLEGSPKVHVSSPLGLGRYHFEAGVAGKSGHCSFELVLFVDGACRYTELTPQGAVRSLPGAARWRVAAVGVLILSGRRPQVHGFHWQESRGNRSLQRPVMRVELSIRVVLQKCTYEPFPQQLEPFPNHQPRETSELVFGRVDLASPVLLGMKCRPDRLPYHAFEDALRRHGLPVDEILSDFVFLDRDADGQVSLENFLELAGYGSPSASPELLHELREALLEVHDTPAAAYQALQAASPSKKVTLESFARYFVVHTPPQESIASNGAKQQQLSRLQAWVSGTSPEDHTAVFASLNPRGADDITLDDFMSINVHTAVLAVRRLDHFQSWLRENFGSSPEVFRQVFRSLDKAQAGVLTRSAFVSGAAMLGYPCGEVATSSMFSLLDRNFDGEVSSRDFLQLRTFNGSEVLKELVALKKLVDDKLGGIDPCFRKMQERERAVQNHASSPKRVSFDTFQRTVASAGFNKLLPDADIKVLFLFITEASGKHANGFLSQGEWALLKGLSSSAIVGSPARLRKILEQRYGGLEEAFQRMHASWMKRALVKGLKQTALGAMARALCAGAAAGEPPASGERAGGWSLHGCSARRPAAAAGLSGAAGTALRPGRYGAASVPVARPPPLPVCA